MSEGKIINYDPLRRRFWQGERSEKQRKRYLFFEEITETTYHINESLRKEIYIPFLHMSVDRYLQEVRRWMKEKIIPDSVWQKLKSSWIGSETSMGPILDKYIEEDLGRICEIARVYARSLEFYYKQEGYEPVR